MIRRTMSLALLAVLGLLALPQAAEAQGRIGRAARRAVENEVEKKVVSVAGDATACAVGNKECADEARENGEKVVFVDEDGNVITDKDGNPITEENQVEGALEGPGTGRWTGYDYLRGARPIFNTWWNILDAENPPARIPNPELRIGRIPPQIVFKEGNMQIIDLDGRATLEMRSKSIFHLPLEETVPEDFSLEFTYYTPRGWAISVYFEPVTARDVERKRGEELEYHFIQLSRSAQISHAYNAGTDVSSTSFIPANDEFTTVEFQIDDGYALMYINGDRVAQIPNFKLPQGSNTIEFFVQAQERGPVYISDIRVDYGVDDPVEVLEAFAAHGEYTTRSIFFDFNSAKLRPESTPELIRIQKMIEDYGQPVVIAGHTDAIGSDDYNMELSAERAEAVKAYLVEAGVDSDLIDTTGKGETEPVGDNETDEGRQANRRVVITSAAGSGQ